MSATSTGKPSAPAPPQQPDFWHQYSPRGECPLSFTAAALLHVALLGGVLLVLFWTLFLSGSESRKPVQMDVVEVEIQGGGGTGGLGVGIGLNESGKSGPQEDIRKGPGAKAIPEKVDDIKLKDIPPEYLEKRGAQEGPIASAGAWAELDREQQLAKQALASRGDGSSGTPGGGSQGSPGKGGGTGGGTGTGVGKGTGPGQGNSKVGVVLTEQRRRELRWRILASTDGDIHLRKLQALGVILYVPLVSDPGSALRYDMTKSTLAPTRVPASEVLSPDRVRWANREPSQVIPLAKALKLKEAPTVLVIVLPPELEADMARRELDHDGRLEHEIQQTIWDLQPGPDGAFKHEPYIVKQILKPGVR